MAISFTEKQQQVIDTHGCNLLVSAAAGSGKTAVLVERIVKMISDETHPVDVDRLLVVTFTNAAAAEMRERISNAISERLVAQPENEHLQRQATLLHNAQITTIDSFCLFVIRNQFHTIDLDPGFRIADEGERKLLRADVLAAVLEEEYSQERQSFLDCMEYFSLGNRDDAVEEVILKLYDFAMSNPFPEKWLAERRKDYLVTAERLEELPWMQFLLQQTRYLLTGCVEKLAEAERLSEQPDGPYPYGALLEKEREMTEQLLHLCSKEKVDYDTLVAAFGGMQFDRLPSKKDDTISAAKREQAKALRTEVKEALGDLQKKYFFQTKEQIIDQMAGCQYAVEGLIDLVLHFKEAFDAGKREKNLLDFDDIEHFALNILVEWQEDGSCKPTSTALEYRKYFKEILIDEYQDSNLVQEYLLSCISGEEEGNYNRFMVGDVKQSIYKFRLARPELFLEKYSQYGAVNRADRAMKIDLHQNFRSRKEVLNVTNKVFEQIMGEEIGGICYDEEAALHPGADYPELEPGQGDAQLLLFQTEEKPEEMSVREQEAYGVAQKIKELLRTHKVTARENGQSILRPVQFRDIVILMRTTAGWDEVFQKVLQQEGIPVHMTSRTGYFAANEVQELLNFLRVLDNPLQDIPLYGVLHSFLGGFSEEEIALLKAAYPKKPYLYDALVLSREENEKVFRFCEKINRYRDMAAYLPIHELLQIILRETDYLNYVAARQDGAKRRANVEMLLMKATEYEKTSYFGLYHFLRYMEQLEKYEVDYGEAGMEDENADVVRLMSVHKSKGLEFPICFVCGLSKSFQMKDANAHLVVDVDGGIGVDYVDASRRVRGKNLRRNVIAEKIRQDNLAEEMRILYVAMTRAKEKLILTGTIKTPAKTAAALSILLGKKERLLPYDVLYGSNSFLSLLLAAFARNHCLDSFYESCEIENAHNNLLYEENMSIRVTIEGWEDMVGDVVEETVRKEGRKRQLLRSSPIEDVDTELMTKMSQQFSYQYPHDNLKDLYTKTTVSELKKAGMEDKEEAKALYEEEPVTPYVPRFIRSDKTVSGSIRGSAFHKVMELFDFTCLTEVLQQEPEAMEAVLHRQVEQMHQERRLSTEYYEAVSLRRLTGFLLSPVALRMAKAARAGKLYKEQPFVLGLPANRLGEQFPTEETVLIQGIIDVFFEEEDGYVLLDYKTDAVERPEELIQRYQIQLAYYTEALEQLSGCRQSGVGKQVKEQIIYSFKLEQEISLPLH